MIAGSKGTFVISWAQTEVDGVAGASIDLLTVGAAWRWTGAAVRVDGASDLLLLEAAEGAAEIRKRAARMVRRLIGTAVGRAEDEAEPALAEVPEDVPDQGFIVTDGVASYALTIIPVPDSGSRLLMMLGDVPPANRDLWVVRTSIDGPGWRRAGARAAG